MEMNLENILEQKNLSDSTHWNTRKHLQNLHENIGAVLCKGLVTPHGSSQHFGASWAFLYDVLSLAGAQMQHNAKKRLTIKSIK